MSDFIAPLAAATIYRAEADECLRRAEATAVPGVRESYHSLALSYIRIAEDMEAAAYGYSDPCVRQQQVYDMYGNVVWQPVRVC